MSEQILPDETIRVADETPGAPPGRFFRYFRGGGCFLAENHKAAFAYPADTTKQVSSVLQCFLVNLYFILFVALAGTWMGESVGVDGAGDGG